MALVCPTILAKDKPTFDKQMKAVADFAHRIQIDLTDGQFASGAELDPKTVWWPAGIKADIHLMYKQPIEVAKEILKHRPNLVIAHSEAEAKFSDFCTMVKSYGCKLGLAILPSTAVEVIKPVIGELDHVLVFSGDLGRFGGQADISLLSKVSELKQLKPELEVGWDGGVNDQNIAELAMGGVDVLNAGGYVQNAENPHNAYAILERIAEEAGTT